MVDWAHAIAAKQRGEHSLHHLAVGNHIGNAAWHTQVVLQYCEASTRELYKVGADYGHVDIVWHLQSAHLATELPATVDERTRYYSGGQNAAFVVNVLEE